MRCDSKPISAVYFSGCWHLCGRLLKAWCIVWMLFFPLTLFAEDSLIVSLDRRINRMSGSETLQSAVYQHPLGRGWAVQGGMAFKAPEDDASLLDGWFSEISYAPEFFAPIEGNFQFRTLTNNYREYNRGDTALSLSAKFCFSRWFSAEAGGFVRFLNLAAGWYSLPFSPQMEFMAFGVRYRLSFGLSPENWPVQLSGGFGNFDSFLQENTDALIFSLRCEWVEDFGLCFVEAGTRPSGTLSLASTWYEVFVRLGMRTLL